MEGCTCRWRRDKAVLLLGIAPDSPSGQTIVVPHQNGSDDEEVVGAARIGAPAVDAEVRGITIQTLKRRAAVMAAEEPVGPERYVNLVPSARVGPDRERLRR